MTKLYKILHVSFTHVGELLLGDHLVDEQVVLHVLEDTMRKIIIHKLNLRNVIFRSDELYLKLFPAGYLFIVFLDLIS